MCRRPAKHKFFNRDKFQLLRLAITLFAIVHDRPVYDAGANDTMMTPVLSVPSDMVVMLTLPAGETGD